MFTLNGATLLLTIWSFAKLCIWSRATDFPSVPVYQSSSALIQESAMTIILVEQCHASCAQIMHRHPQPVQESLCCKMLVHNSRTLFHPPAFAKEEDKLRELIDDLGRQMQNQSHAGPRQMYCQLLVRHAKTLCLLGDHSEHAVRRSVFKLHGKQYE